MRSTPVDPSIACEMTIVAEAFYRANGFQWKDEEPCCNPDNFQQFNTKRGHLQDCSKSNCFEMVKWSGDCTIKHYGSVIFRFQGKLVCLLKPVIVTDGSTALAYYDICPFSVPYESVMFYNKSPWLWEWKLKGDRCPQSCLDRVFNSKLGCFAVLHNKYMTCIQPQLELDTGPRFSPFHQSFAFMTKPKT
jgi:hypothetical protein